MVITSPKNSGSRVSIQILDDSGNMIHEFNWSTGEKISQKTCLEIATRDANKMIESGNFPQNKITYYL